MISDLTSVSVKRGPLVQVTINQIAGGEELLCDVREIRLGIAELRKLLLLSEVDRAKLREAAAKLDKSTAALAEIVSATPVP